MPHSTAAKSVRDCELGIVMAVDAQGELDDRLDLPDRVLYLRRQRPAIGIAQDNDIGASFCCGLQSLQRVFRIGGESVEKVLGVIDDFSPFGLEIGDRCSNELTVSD